MKVLHNSGDRVLSCGLVIGIAHPKFHSKFRTGDSDLRFNKIKKMKWTHGVIPDRIESHSINRSFYILGEENGWFQQEICIKKKTGI